MSEKREWWVAGCEGDKLLRVDGRNEKDGNRLMRSGLEK